MEWLDSLVSMVSPATEQQKLEAKSREAQQLVGVKKKEEAKKAEEEILPLLEEASKSEGGISKFLDESFLGDLFGDDILGKATFISALITGINLFLPAALGAISPTEKAIAQKQGIKSLAGKFKGKHKGTFLEGGFSNLVTDALKSSKKINPALTGLASFGTSAIMSSLGQGLSKGFKSFFGKGGFKGVGEQMASLPKMPKSEMAVGKDFLKKLSPESIADLAPADATEIISQYQKTYMPETTKGLGKFGPKTKLSIEDLTKKIKLSELQGTPGKARMDIMKSMVADKPVGSQATFFDPVTESIDSQSKMMKNLTLLSSLYGLSQQGEDELDYTNYFDL